jgi:hypothetical protein
MGHHQDEAKEGQVPLRSEGAAGAGAAHRSDGMGR